MNFVILLAAMAALAPNYEPAPVPCETEALALQVAQWERPPETSRWVMTLGRDWREGTSKLEKFKRPWRWYFRHTLVRVDGADGDFTLTVNGKARGVSKGVRPVVEFDITEALKLLGENELKFEFAAPRSSPERLRKVYVVSVSGSSPRGLRALTKLDAEGKRGSFSIVDEKGSQIKSRQVENPICWSDEYPAVYMTPVEHRYGWWIFGGTEYRVVRLGFTRYSVKDGIICNGSLPARIHLVAPHKTTPGRDGRFTDRPRLVLDSGVIKSVCANAVLARDYPKCHDWYDLCDRDGIYVLATAEDRVPGGHPSVIEVPAGALPKNQIAIDDELKEISRLRERLQPIRVTGIDWQSMTVKLYNDYRFTPLSKLSHLKWTGLDAQGKKVSEAWVQGINAEPMATGEVKLIDFAGDAVKLEFFKDDDLVTELTIRRPVAKKEK